MSTRISRALIPLAFLALAGCVGGLTSGGEDAPASVQVTTDLITIGGPRGFCVDPTLTRNEGDTGFVLLGNCAAISGNARVRQPNVAAVLTAAVSARSDGTSLTDNLPALEAFFETEEGRELLSRSGQAGTVQILETRLSDGMLLLHARDTSAAALSGVAQDYWRAYLDLGPRLATLSVLALADQDVSDADALDTLTRFTTIVQRANSGGAVVPNAADLPQARDEAGPRPFRTGLFQRIFQ